MSIKFNIDKLDHTTASRCALFNSWMNANRVIYHGLTNNRLHILFTSTARHLCNGFLVEKVDLRKYTNYQDLVIAYVSCIAWFGRGCIHRGAVSLKESVKKN